MFKQLIGPSVLPVQYIAVSALAHGAFFFFVFLGAFQENGHPKQAPRSDVIEVAIYHSPPRTQTAIPPQKKEAPANVDVSHSSPKVPVRDIHIPNISVGKPQNVSDPALESRQSVPEVAELSPIIQKNDDYSAEIKTSPAARHPETSKSTKLTKKGTYNQGGLDWLSMFPAMVAEKVQERLPSTPMLTKAQCTLSIRLAADGTLVEIDNYSGDQELCDNAKSILHSIGRFDLPENIPDKQSFLRHLIINVESATQ